MIYTIELSKHIVVQVEADDETDARQQAVDDQEGWDGAWERAEPQIVAILDIAKD